MIAPKLRFSEFKDEWFEKKLEEIATVERGKFSPRPRNDPKFYNGEMPFIQTGDVANCGIYLEKYTQTLNEEGIKVSKVFPKNSILITIAANIGDTAITRFPVACPDSLVAIQPLENIANTHFLNNLLELKKEYLDSQATQNAQKNINLQVLKPLELVIPNYQEQTKIAEFLSAVDDKISQLSRQLELLNQYKKGVMQKIFSQEIRFKNDNGEDFGDWEEIQLKDFLTLTLRPVDKPNENYHALGVRSHFKGLFNKYDSQPEKNSMDVLYEVFENDIVVNITFAWEGAMAIANKIHHKGLVSHRFPTYQTDESKILLNFFRYIFIQKDFLAELQLCSPGGAGRNRVLSKKDFLEISILKPSVQEQAKIAEFLTAIGERIDHTTAQLTHTKQWKKGLLQQMFV